MPFHSIGILWQFPPERGNGRANTSFVWLVAGHFCMTALSHDEALGRGSTVIEAIYDMITDRKKYSPDTLRRLSEKLRH